MTELDKKLSDLIGDSGYGSDMVYFLNDDFIEKIKQVFLEAGYISPEEVAKWQKIVNVLAESFTTAMQLPTKQYVALDKKQQTMQDLMTGTDWYKNFKAQFGDDANHCTDIGCSCDVLLAARRAAGLEENA